ncbi:uncharacterized protein HD556DRAFT_1440760 [Suillus plorans]|uniref:Uncharacterized protein n=1 Tax=Suillus plorans TaxID=116603 RepID=A0A9P7DLJ1_9AGAM|nr:uncharacterized protein HD556DRAFT_1440760 [Suillus plorans]KAG1797799.1 hypothetical protein HD556DRAFT_1440760 [Suillus plorans]
MPPHTVAIPKKKQAKCKEPVEASGTPLVSLRLDATSTDEPGRRSGCANAGTGGMNAQLEKIGAVLEAPSQVHRPKGSTSLGSTAPVNPQAPEPLCGKGQGRRPKVTPPPYSSPAATNVPNTPHVDVSTVEPLQPLNILFCQAGGRFRFTMHAPTVPPDPDLSNLHAPVDRKVAAKPDYKTVTGPSQANLVALPARFLDQNIDPALRGINVVEPQSFEGGC